MLRGIGVLILCLVLLPITALAAEEGAEVEYIPSMYATFWALVPPVVAIVLALITKEVYSSLFIGILVGGLFYSGFSFEGTLTHIFNGGFVAVLSDGYNVGILIFLVILGAMVSLMNRAGGSAAFGHYAKEKIKTRAGAQLATVALGVLIFIDDYFNCLTVGSVMKPVTDEHKVSRAKLAYLIDATAAPVCIIAPISSWAAAVSGFVEGEDGFSIFIRAIPYNFYAILTIIMMISIVLMKVDFGSMKTHEANALKGDLFSTGQAASGQEQETVNRKGKVIDLLIPIALLIISCVIGMIYTGGFFDGAGFVEAFSNSDASVGLALGSICAMILTIIIYLIRRVLSFTDCMKCLPDGFKAMVPAILILTFAWTLKAMTDSLGNIWHSDPDCGKCIYEHEPAAYDHFHFGLYGRSGMRRSLFAHIRYHDHGVSGCAVRPCESCVHTASLCDCGGGDFLCHIHRGRLRTESVDFSAGGNRAAVSSAGGDQEQKRRERAGVTARYACMAQAAVL